MTWRIPGQRDPFLECSDPALKNIQYISFSGYNSRPTDVYFADCPTMDNLNPIIEPRSS